MATRKPADLALQPVAGDGLLLRHGEAVVLGVGGARLDAVLDTCRSVVDGGGDGRRLVRQLAVLLAEDDDDDLKALVTVAPTDAGLATLVYGDAELVVTDESGADEVLSGKSSSAWVDRIVSGAVQRLSAHVGKPSKAEPDSRADFREGVVTAGGFVGVYGTATKPKARARKSVATPVEPDPAPTELQPALLEPLVTESMPPPLAEESFESVSLLEPAADEPSEPLPVAGGAAPAAAGAVVVQGIVCKRGHFNAPGAAFCGVCGISMVQQTHELVDGPRPPLGVIVLDDGATFRLDDDYVLGREPDNDAEVLAGHARPLTIADDEGTVSRAHVLVHLDGWDVQLIDRNSANGTYVAAPGTTVWTPLQPQAPVTIVPGTRVQVGRRTFTFDAHNRV